MKDNFNGSFEKNYELVVMGTGPGGATVAREMAKRGKKEPRSGQPAGRG